MHRKTARSRKHFYSRSCWKIPIVGAAHAEGKRCSHETFMVRGRICWKPSEMCNAQPESKEVSDKIGWWP